MKEYYCEKCGFFVNTELKPKEETFKVRDEEITCKLTYRICKTCGEIIWDRELDAKNCKIEFEEYKKKKGLMTAEEIKDLRKQYDLTQTELAELIGVGEKTIARYENGAIQDLAIDNLLRLVKIPFVKNVLSGFQLQNSYSTNKIVSISEAYERVGKSIYCVKTKYELEEN